MHAAKHKDSALEQYLGCVGNLRGTFLLLHALGLFDLDLLKVAKPSLAPSHW